MMKQADIRRKLIDGTIRVIAREGLDNASTKLIGMETSVNQVYIYRCFADKEDLLAKTFATLDDEFFAKLMQYIDVMYTRELEYETRCRQYFKAVWMFMMANRDRCLTYIRYYYSPYFTKHSLEEHHKRFRPLIDKIREAFREETQVGLVLHHILNVMLDFAVKVHTWQMPNDDDHEEHVFRVIYRSIEQYFR